MSEQYETYRIYFEGITYDSDYGERIDVFADIKDKEKFDIFFDFLKAFCETSNITDYHAYYPHRTIVSFDDLEKALENYKGDSFKREMQMLVDNYDSGFFYLENPRKVYVEHLHRETPL